VQERADLVELYDATEVGEALAPSYNVAPTNEVEAVLEHADRTTEHVDRQLRTLQWGLVPSWAKDPKTGNRLINARVETLADKPSWRGPFRRQRAVIPAAGYYEWAPREHDTAVRKQPFYLHPIDPNGVLSFAGLYEMWRDPTKTKSDPARWLWTAVIVTTDATGAAGDIHDRTPLILPRDRVDAWLDPSRTEPDEIYEVLDGIVLEPLAVRAVSTRVNRVGTDGPDLIQPLAEHRDEPLQLTQPDGEFCVEHWADADRADDYVELLDAVRRELAPPPDNVLSLPVARRAQLSEEGAMATQVTITGRAGNDAVLKTTDAGVKFATFRLADTPRIRDITAPGGWRDGETTWHNVVAWRTLAENVAASVRSGMPITVVGELRTRTLPPLPGEAKGLTIQEVHASDVSVSMGTGV
jgi:putative SOS response-associated peptidase YedK